MQFGDIYHKRYYKHPNEFVISKMVGLVTFCFPKSIFSKIGLDERFHLWEDTHFLLRVFDQYNFSQINSYGYIYRMHSHMGSRLDMKSGSIVDALENNIAPIMDYFDHYNTQLSLTLRDELISKKILEYSISDMVYGEGNNAIKFLKRSIQTKISFSYFRLYVNFIKIFVSKWVGFDVKKREVSKNSNE